MYTKRNNRRQFLKLASGLMAAPLGSMSMYAKSQSISQKPLRFLTIIDHYGVPLATRNSTWVPSTAGDYALSDDDLGTILQPLSAYRENMLIISNTDLESHRRSGAKATHHEFVPHTLGASATLDGSGQREASARLLHESADVMIGNYLNNNFSSNRVYPHLFFTDYAARDTPTYCFDTSGVMIRSIAGAISGVDTIFGSSTSAVSEVDPTLEALLLARKDLLGQVSSRVQMLKSQFSHASYHEKIDAYDTSLSELATQLELQQTQSCSAPTETLTDNINSLESRSQILTLIGKLFSCDMASSITYAFGGELQNSLRHSFLSDDNDEVQTLLNRTFHGSSHNTSSIGDKSHELIRIHQSELIAELMDTLATTLDIDGSPILDNTVVYMPTTMARNTHQNTDYALMIMAGKNTNLQGGFHYDCGGQSNNEILVTIAQGLNIPITSFGGYHENGNRVDDLNTGPISKMLKTTLG